MAVLGTGKDPGACHSTAPARPPTRAGAAARFAQGPPAGPFSLREAGRQTFLSVRPGVGGRGRRAEVPGSASTGLPKAPAPATRADEGAPQTVLAMRPQ